MAHSQPRQWPGLTLTFRISRTRKVRALRRRARALASPFQFTNYHTSYCMQAIGDGKATMLHACVRELAVYIPGMFLLDRLFGETGLAAALPVSEAISAMIALALLRHVIDRARSHRGRFSV